MFKKIRWDILGYMVLLLLAGAVLYHTYRTNNQAIPSFVLETEFIGEYMLGESDWKPLDQNTRLSSFDGDLVLRGNFRENFPMCISFHLNHIGISISVNGTEIYKSGDSDKDLNEMVCANAWSDWLYEGLAPEDVIEIRLHNPHCYGNAGAYEEFLASLHYGGGSALANHLEQQSKPYRITGNCMLLLAIALLGLSLGFWIHKLHNADLFFRMGVLTLFMSGYILMDTIDMDFRTDMLSVCTCVRQCCILLGLLTFINIVSKMLTGKRKNIAGILTVALGIITGISLLLSLTDLMRLYNAEAYLAVAQGSAALLSLWLCIQEYRHREKRNRVMLLSCMLLLPAVILELLNGRLNLWTNGILIKVLFSIVLIFHLLRAVRSTVSNLKNTGKINELTAELKNRSIMLSMSQIRTHFVFNILTAISGMCQYDPNKADEVLIRFSRYLRNNIDIMQEDKIETFTKSMQHLEDYIALEQIRFGNRLQFVKELEIENFKIPPLILQPIVENSIKHGLFPKPDGGTITLQTREVNGTIEIIIVDDGVGYDMNTLKKEESVGLDNVRFRLKYMEKGSLDIESTPGTGTKVTIRIPTKEAML